MQYWIFFFPGVGGDGFCNLLENAKDINTADGKKEWRIHKNFGKKIKFFGANWCNDPIPFRNLTENNNIIINENFKNIVENNLNTIIPTHYLYFQTIENFRFKNLVEKNQIKVHLYSNNYKNVAENYILKNELDAIIENLMSLCRLRIQSQLKNSDYFLHIDIDKALEDWDYLNENLKKLKIDLDKKYWIEYKNLINYPNN